MIGYVAVFESILDGDTDKFYEISLSESTRPLIQPDIYHKAIEIEVTAERNEPESI